MTLNAGNYYASNYGNALYTVFNPGQEAGTRLTDGDYDSYVQTGGAATMRFGFAGMNPPIIPTKVRILTRTGGLARFWSGSKPTLLYLQGSNTGTASTDWKTIAKLSPTPVNNVGGTWYNYTLGTVFGAYKNIAVYYVSADTAVTRDDTGEIQFYGYPSK